MISAFLSKLSQDKAKHVLGVESLFLISGKHAGYQPGLGRGTTPLGRDIVPMTTFKEMKSGKSGCPSNEHEEHEGQEHKEHEMLK